MSDLLVIVPSRGRPENVERVVAAWDATNAWDCADLWAIVDQDDPRIFGYRALEDSAACPLRLAEVATWRPMVHKLDLVAAQVAAEGRHFALAFAGDDHLPRSPGWAARYLQELHELGTGIVYGDDGIQGERLPTQWAMTADIVRELGRMVPAPVEHLYCDNAIRDLGQAAGCLRYLPDVLIEHMHPVAGKAPIDAGYARVNRTEQYRADRFRYQTWCRDGLTADAEKVRALRAVRSA